MSSKREKYKANFILQTYFKNRINGFNECYMLKEGMLVKINDILEKIEFNFKNDVIDQDTYNDYMMTMEDIIEHFQKIPTIKNNSLNINHYNIDIKTELYIIKEKLDGVINKIGFTKLNNILMITIDDEWKEQLPKKQVKLLEFLNKCFIPLNSKIDISTFQSLVKKDRIFRVPQNNIIENIQIKNLTYVSMNIKERLHGANILIPHKEKTIFISGLFSKDSLNLYKKNGIFATKYNNLLRQLKLTNIPLSFSMGYIDQLTLKDFIVLPIKRIKIITLNAWNDHNKYNNKTLSTLVKEFLMCNLLDQKNMISILLLSDDVKTKHLAYLLYDMVSTSSDTLKPQFMAEDIYKALHWQIQKKFKQAYKKVSEFRHKIQNYNNIEIPYEDRILQMEAPEYIKSKALNKLNEIKTTKDSYKAKNYLDGLLKIPFGKFVQEEIIVFLNNFTGKINKLQKEIILNSKMYFTSDDEIYNNIYTLLNKLNIGKIETENMIDDYLVLCNDIVTDVNSELNRLSIETNEKTEEICNNKTIEFENGIKLVTEGKYKLSEVNHYENKYHSIWLSIEQSINNNISDWCAYKEKKKKYIKQVREILNKSVYGQEEAKKQIERLVAQWINGKQEGTIFGIQGPPGVGKTTLCKKGLAECLRDDNDKPRPFYLIALGGTSNGSTLVGHNYTYVGSTWGKIVDILMETKCMNPIIYIDEVDKVSRTERGKEIIGILTHLTDDSQNKEFQDKYFSGVKLDLSQALIVFSYNDSDLLDPILRDRITEIRIKPCTKNDKVKIMQGYVIPELLEITGYKKGDITFDDEVIRYITENYTIEAGVRKLKEKIFELIREINLQRVFSDNIVLPYQVTIDFVKEHFSDKPRISFKKIAPKPHVGLVNGLYATRAGTGGITLIEVMKTPPNDSKLGLELTGQQGDVMKESMKCARTVAWNIIPKEIKKNIKNEWEEIGNYGLHIHCPEASTPKDGPSAGITITTGIVSRLTNIPINNTIAMTGEIDLNGKVRRIGGLEYKLDGAKRAGVKTVLIPEDNKEDFEIILSKMEEEDRDELMDDFQVIAVRTIKEVLQHALVSNEILFNYD